MAHEVVRHRSAAKPCPYDDQDRHELDDKPVRGKHDQPVQGIGQIVRHDGRKIDAQPEIPGKERGAPVPQFFPELSKKRRVLMIHIRMKDTVRAERPDAGKGHDDQHDDDRHREGSQYRTTGF